ncbi:methylglyoxal reductase (NADPH-dependent) gre2 [Gonapodya sp. JEL0774]|nr:methylglyoxal reductase (NADPH-dependent) gre2 [Gonapodya sp. JEL0774]
MAGAYSATSPFGFFLSRTDRERNSSGFVPVPDSLYPGAMPYSAQQKLAPAAAGDGPLHFDKLWKSPSRDAQSTALCGQQDFPERLSSKQDFIMDDSNMRMIRVGVSCEKVNTPSASRISAVRAAVRSSEKAFALTSALRFALKDVMYLLPEDTWRGTQLSDEDETAARFVTVIIPDMEAEGCYDEAANDCTGIVHVASPLSTSRTYTDYESELARPILRGTQSILRAASVHPTIRRVVITSTFGSVLRPGQELPYTYDERDWNTDSTVEEGGFSAYRAAKTRAERWAWDYVSKHTDSHFDLVTLCPPQIIGPLLHPAGRSIWEFSLSNIHSILAQPPPGSSLLQGGAGFVDVRDVAEAHARAVRNASNENTGCVADHGDELGDGGFGTEVPLVFGINNTKSKALLGLCYRSFEDSVRESIEQYMLLQR